MTRGRRPSQFDAARTILVTDGEQRAALAVVRSLGCAGYRVLVASHHRRSLAGASRWCAEIVHTADPLLMPDEYASTIISRCSTEEATGLIPVAEASMLALLGRRHDLPERTLLPFPDISAFQRISDKRLLLETAAELGVSVPRQVVLESCSSASIDDAVSQSRFPVVIKPSRSVGEANGRREKLGVEYADSRAALREQLVRLPPAAFPVLLQERVVGPGVGIFLLVWDGSTRAVFAHRRLREKPPSGGVSVYRESIAASPELVDASERLLAAFGWNGVAMVEFKIDARTGQPYLMEVNGRFWGSLQLAIDAGVDFPNLLLETAGSSGELTPPLLRYRTGVRSRWWWGDVDQLLLRLRNRPPAGSLPPDAPGRIRTLIEFLKLWRPGDRNEVFRLRDPGPFLRESLNWFQGT